MRNQPKYHLIKNATYALKGLRDILRNESSFRIEVVIAFIMIGVILMLDASLTQKGLLFVSLMGMLVTEAMNSAIERVTDLVTLEHHDMAGRAKDAGSAAVFLSVVVLAVTWLAVLADVYL